MKLFLLISSWLFCGFIQTGFAQDQAGKVLIRLNLKKSGISIQEIPGSVDVAGQDLDKNTIDIVGSREYFEILKDRGYDVQIFEEQTEGIDPRYLTSDKILGLVKELETQYPDLVHVEKIGESLKGRPLVAVRLSTPENVEYKPTILFNGMHHAREIMTTEVTTDIMIFLVKNFNNAEMPWVTEWLKHIAIWVIPQVNPDGNDIVWTSDNWWRKNARGDSRGSVWGVDINRNYPYEWAKCDGSSGSQGSQTYRGAAAASEPETQAVMKFVKEKNIAIDISYHSYSELVIAPYGCQNHYTPENAIVQKWGSAFSKLLKKDDGGGTYTYGTGWEILYPVDGDDISWMYNEVNALAYVVEMNGSNQGFQPNYERWRNRTVEAQRPGWQFLLNQLLNGPQVRGRMRDAKTGAPIDGFVKIGGVKYGDEKPRAAKNGVFYKLLVPGSYDLIFSAPGYKSQSLSISVDEKSAVTQDVLLEAGLEIDEP
jgi:hypothetical protein